MTFLTSMSTTFDTHFAEFRLQSAPSSRFY